MKLLSSNFSRRQVRAFTLPEILVVVAIFSLLVAATVSAQIFGLRMYRISETKLTTTANARRALNFIRDEIRSGKQLYVGNGRQFGEIFRGRAGQQAARRKRAQDLPHVGHQ